jgi:hypothetical protein
LRAYIALGVPVAQGDWAAEFDATLFASVADLQIAIA